MSAAPHLPTDVNHPKGLPLFYAPDIPVDQGPFSADQQENGRSSHLKCLRPVATRTSDPCVHSVAFFGTLPVKAREHVPSDLSARPFIMRCCSFAIDRSHQTFSSAEPDPNLSYDLQRAFCPAMMYVQRGLVPSMT